MREIVIDITPTPAPRMTQQDRWAKRPAVVRYIGFQKHLVMLCNIKGLTALPNEMGWTFEMPIPKSWSKKKKAEMIGRPHRQKPDLDNLIKGFQDSMTYGREDDDSHIDSYLPTRKIWAEIGRIIIYVND